MNVNQKLASILLFGVGGVACSGENSVDLGDREVHKLGSELSDYAAHWDGYAEAFEFSDGSDRVRLSLDEYGDGTLQVGDSPPVNPPTDPNVGYPTSSLDRPETFHDLRVGFDYPIQDAALASERIQLSALPGDFIAPWCELQTPILDEVNTAEPNYSCAPNGPMRGNAETNECFVGTDPEVPIDCGRLNLCNLYRACWCTATACAAADTGTVPFDGALFDEGNTLVGTLVQGGSRVTVRLSRSSD